MSIESYMIWIWLGVFVISLIVEAATQELVSIWFAVGSLISVILSVIDGFPYYYEIILFFVISGLLMLFTRPTVKKILKNQIRSTNVDDFIGKRVKLVEGIKEDVMGLIKINDIIYNAVIPTGENYTVEAGEYVEIVAVRGNKIVVKKINEVI